MQKVLTISIAAYNVEKYIEKTLNSLLVKNIDDLEILVEDDGGTDNTGSIVKEYEKKYPDIVKLIHKENGGYGSTINKSIEIAQGKFFKQLDGDDWYDSDSFEQYLDILRKIDSDAVYTPYIRYIQKKNERILKDYFNQEVTGYYNVDKIINNATHPLTMYTMTFKTSILKNNNIKLLTKSLYTDTEYSMYPTLYINTIYISHLPLYIYRIGNEEQSMSIESKRRHYIEEINVTKRNLNIVNENIENLSSEKRKYFINYLGFQCANCISEFLIILHSSRNNLDKIKEFEQYVYDINKEAHEAMLQISKIAQILKKLNYNFLIYKIISYIKIRKVKKTW